MGSSTRSRTFSFTCQECGATGTPVRVESQTPDVIVLSINCATCTHQWAIEGDLPAFMTWLKPDPRRSARFE